MKSIKKASNNQINESLCCLSELKRIIERDFAHVEILSTNIINSINKDFDRIWAERDRRDDQF